MRQTIRRLGFRSRLGESSSVDDRIAPVPTITSGSSSPVYGAITARVTFTNGATGEVENVNSFVVGDITPGNCTLSGFTQISDGIYDVIVNPTYPGTITLDIAAGVCTDLAGNLSVAAAQFSRTYVLQDGFASDSGRWLDGDLAAAAMTISAGKGIWTPTYGSDKLTNGNMETGSPPSNWTQESSMTLSAAADERTGGAGAQSLDIAAGAVGPLNNGASQSVPTTARRFYYIDWWVKRIVGSGALLRFGSYIQNGSVYTSASWGNRLMTAPAVGANTSVRLTLYNATTGDSGRYDDVVVKEVTPATMYRVQRIAAPAYVEAKIWRTQFAQKGVCFYKDANNMILAYFGLDNKIEMIKRVAGTWSALLGSVTYSHTAGYAIRLTPNAGWTSFTVSANGVDKIGPISITDLAFTGTWYAGVFNTYDSGNIANDAFDDFTIVPV